MQVEIGKVHTAQSPITQRDINVQPYIPQIGNLDAQKDKAIVYWSQNEEKE